MKIVLQRVREASVKIEGETAGQIAEGLLLLLGIHETDTPEVADWLMKKCIELRIFEDTDGKMNHSVIDTKGGVLVVPNFTLYANAKKGKRPSFMGAAPPEYSKTLFTYFVDKLSESEVRTVASGVFGADMQVSLVNDGPVTLVLDTDEIMPK